MKWLQRLGLALVMGIAGCSCELFAFPDLEGDGCLLGSECPDGTCMLALFWPTDCCGFGGECPVCEGAWVPQIECPDGTCVAPGSDDPCCVHGGACDPGDDESGAVSLGESGADDLRPVPATSSASDSGSESGSGSSGSRGSSGSSDDTGTGTGTTGDTVEATESSSSSR